MKYKIQNLTKDLLRKPAKSEEMTELKIMAAQKAATHLPPTNHERVVIIDFMAYARKVPIKKLKSRTLKHMTIFSAVSIHVIEST